MSLGDNKCYVCFGNFAERYLQIDHRIPYEISTDKDFSKRDVLNYMLLCGSCNRAKSWSCEHCENWKKKKDPAICKTCYWASPENYDHIAKKMVRRLDLIWIDKDVNNYEDLTKLADKTSDGLPKYVKNVIKKHVDNIDS